MNYKNLKAWKRIVAGAMSVAMLVPIISTFPVQAMDSDVKLYSYDDFEVEYSVVGEWKNHQNVKVTVRNTSDEPMYNWAFKYNANGKIGEMWGAETLECIDDAYVIGSKNYDSRIDNTVTFGYILECDDDTVQAPDDFKLCTKRVDLSSGFDVKMNIVNEWADSCVGEFQIMNTSEEPIVGWNLSFRSTNNIECVWNGKLTDSSDNNYCIEAGDYGYYIDPGSTVKIGFIADKSKDSDFTIDSFDLSSIVCDWTFDEMPDMTDPTDTDSDKLTDVYEKHIYGTDPKKSDTDGDKLPDGYEVITLHSNPREADSDNNKVTDDVEDFDTDKLTNYEEYELGTNPLLADTDDDGLSDYEEVKVYGTDPLNPDTDGDSVIDGDEVFLGLDPNNKEDGDTPVHQTLTEEELTVNEDNHDFQVSMDVTASNNIHNYITEDISPYSGILSDNRSIIGRPIDLEYEAGVVTDGTITFRMNEETINSATHYFDDFDAGFERYGIFIFDESIGTIVPVPAEYDEENLTITIDAAAFMGNLMIIDYESLMYDLGIDPREEAEDEEEPAEEETTSSETTMDETTTVAPTSEATETSDHTTKITADEGESTETTAAETATVEPIAEITTSELDETTAAETIASVTASDIESTKTTVPETIAAETIASVTASDIEATKTTVSETVTTEPIAETKTVEAVSEKDDLDEIKIAANRMMAPVSLTASVPTPKSAPAWHQVDLTIVIDTTGSMSSSINQVRTNLTNLIDKLREDNISLYVSLVDFKDITYTNEYTILNNNNGKQFYSSMDDVKSAISGMKATGGGDTEETDIDGLGQAYSLNYRSSASKFVFLITDASYKTNNNFGMKSLQDVADKLHSKGIFTSAITPQSLYSTYSALASDPDKSFIPLNSNFCDAMYAIISSGASADAVVIGSNLVTGVFGEKLKYGGTYDTDKDGLSDSAEIDWDFVKDYDKDTGEYELYTWEKLCSKGLFNKPYKGGKQNVLYSKLKNVEVIPALSNPFSADSDGDYYPDNKDEDPLKMNNMYINDAGINDDNYHNGEEITSVDSSKFTDGVLKINNTDKTSKYVFTRKTNTNYKFNLTPEKNSYYKFDSSASIHRTIKITYKGIIKPHTVEPNSDGTYCLERGKDYTISIYAESDYSSTYEDYSFTAAQDNWVYAPDGGKWEVTQYSTTSAMVGLLYDEMMYMPSSRIVSSICQLTGGTQVEVDPSGDVEKQINTILSLNGMIVTPEELDSAVTTIGGAALTTTLFFFPTPAGKVEGVVKVAKIIISTGANICTYKGTPSAIETLLNYMEQCGFKRAYTEGYANVCAAKYYTQPGRVWDPWLTTPYINKVSNMGDFGKVDKTITDSEIISWCDWHLKESA